MTEPDQAPPPLTHEELPRLHDLTSEVARLCRTQLRTYLDALAPLFRPRRVLGNHMEGAGKENVTAADQNLAELREVYFKACGRPFDLRKELPTPLESVPTQVQLHEWEYPYEIRTERERRTITIVSPLTWVLAYPSPYTHSMVRQVVSGKQERDAESVRSFVLRASLMHLLFTRVPEMATLFAALRYEVQVRTTPQLGELPLVTVSAPLETSRPDDELLMRAAGLSGRTGFVEVINLEQAAHLPDPFEEQILKILNAENSSSHST